MPAARSAAEAAKVNKTSPRRASDAEAQPLADELLCALARLDDPIRIAGLLVDLLSAAELRSVQERWAIVRGLRAGHSQRAVRDAVGCSIATVSRGAAQLRESAGGFEAAFAVLQDVAP